jgi:hypothetical protein
MAIKPESVDQYSDEETVSRREAALKQMLSMPPRPHSEMKLGKSKSKSGANQKKRVRASTKVK